MVPMMVKLGDYSELWIRFEH